ncbi:MAG: polysaccharide deacetylase family protein [Proteobacteria bacterium]|nr:polysaccharide deacetylase family protein [Pseudomonadota bacterium]
MNGVLCIALHDVAPATWDACRVWLDELDALDAHALTLLLVPDFHARGGFEHVPAVVRALQQRATRGDELAQHGLVHLDQAPAPRTPVAWLRRRVLTAGEGEFAALDESAAALRLARGRELLGAAGLRVEGFVAPAWLASVGTWRALRAAGYAWTSDHRALYDLAQATRHAAPVLTASPRSAWRRGASRVWLTALLHATRAAPLLRVGLHPADVAHPALLRAWRDVLRELLAQRACSTKAAALRMSRMVPSAEHAA